MEVMKRLFTTLIITASFVYMGYILISQQTRINDLNEELTYYKKEIQEQQLETEKLNDTLSSLSDDEYMEEVARDSLDLVMPYEIVFKDVTAD